MKKFSIQDIRSWDPCYDPVKYLAEDWEGTALDILRHETIPPQDKLWAVCREDLIDAKTLRLFAVWCARQVEHLVTDEWSKNALDVAGQYATGEATDDELAAAWDASWEAARAARAAMIDAARDAARNDARDAVLAAARHAVWEAARAETAWAAAIAAARAAQIAHLIEMLGE